MRNFKELRIWQNGMDIAVKTYELAAHFRQEDRYGIGQQITRAAVSIPSNIAEGSSRSSEKDYARFIEISLGSTFELETQIILAERLGKGNPQLIQQLKTDIENQQRMVTGFQARLTR